MKGFPTVVHTYSRHLSAPARLFFSAIVCLLLLSGLSTSAAAKYASIVIDAETGAVLHASGADTRNYPASLTKMMTLYLTFDALNSGKLQLNQRLPVSARAAGQAPSKLGLRAGDSIEVEDAILALVTKSANDASVVLAEAIGGTEAKFAQMMTDKARKIGMTRTTFRNANGLPNAQQLTTARDMARLGQALIYDHKKYYRYFSTTNFQFRGANHHNHNRLMSRYEGMDGLKTGFINASGFNLVASATRDGRRLIGVVMGGETSGWRDRHMAELLDRGFSGAAGARVLVAAKGKAKPAPAERTDPTIGDVVNAVAKADLGLTGTAVAAPLAPEMATQAAPSGWGVQVGAFSDRAASQRAVAQATERAGGLLNGAVPHLSEARADRGTIYRARLMGLDEKTARAACARLAKAGATCLTVPPKGL
ncbi:MAG TPA: D-alanyl-D-alanine carboxypeptidase family protein [Azospirillaceae bacterium]|nr:D-alanyl-D-alanine carboxypeptidase family protein [Azospirillaceae bacterium]